MAITNHSLKNIIGGVSQQYEEARFETQVEEMVNCQPTPARGVLRRNLNINQGFAPLTFDLNKDAYVKHLDYGNGEEYIMAVTKWDMNRDNVYLYNLNTKVITSFKKGYLHTDNPSEDITALTIRDTTFLLNKNVKVTYDLVEDPMKQDFAGDATIYHIKKVDNRVISQKQVMEDDPNDATKKISISGTKTEGYTYTLNITIVSSDPLVASAYTLKRTIKGLTDTRPEMPEYLNNTPERVAELMADKINLNDNIYVIAEAKGAYVIVRPKAGFKISSNSYTDSYTNQASMLVSGTITDESLLPASVPVNTIVKVQEVGQPPEQVRYLSYNIVTQTWTEVANPYKHWDTDTETMPHALYHLGIDNFKVSTFREIDSSGVLGVSRWADIKSGGVIEHYPSFNLKPITDMVFFRNRLGFITEDSIVLSRTDDYGNFFPHSIKDVLDDDPIDITVATTDVNKLRRAVPTDSQLVLFADSAQFTLDSGDRAMTPKNASLLQVTAYEYNKDVPAMAIGDQLFFTVKTGDYLQLLSFHANNRQSSASKATLLTRHVPHYLPKTIKSLVGSGTEGKLLMTADGNEIFVFDWIRASNGEWVQQSFHKWTYEYPDKLANSVLHNHTLYMVTNKATIFSQDIIASNVVAGTVYDGTEEEAYIKFSEFEMKDQRNLGTSRGKALVRSIEFTLEKGSQWLTEVLTNDKSYHQIPYSIQYLNHTRLTPMTKTDTASIYFRSYQDKGFELNTINVELLHNQRTQRR